jgi:CHAT domain-containing protein/Tfp pilus assembly protein PilF
LKPEQSIEREIRGGEAHVYVLKLKAGQLLDVVVEQRGVDVTLTLYAPGGEKLSESDSPNGARGPEPLLWIATAAGDYRLEVRSTDKSAAAGSYEARVAKLQRASDADRKRVAEHTELMREIGHLVERSRQLYEEKRYAEAIHPVESLLQIEERLYGTTSPSLISTLRDLGQLHWQAKEPARTAAYLERVLAINESQGSDPKEIVRSLSDLGGVLVTLGDAARAETILLRALDATEKLRGPEHPEVADALDNLARLYEQENAAAREEPLRRRAAEIREKSPAGDPADLNAELTRLVALARERKDEARIDETLARIVAARARAQGSDSYEVAETLRKLALEAFDRDEYKRAAPLYERALAIKGKRLGPDHIEVAALCNNLALTYDKLFEYARAESLYLRALGIAEKTYGSDHTEVATGLVNVASHYVEKGDFARAEPLYERALRIREKALGPEHADVADTLDEMVALYYSEGEAARARPLIERSLAITEKEFGPEDARVATRLNAAGLIYSEQGDMARAGDAFRRALSIKEKQLGPEHPSLITTINNLAVLYLRLGDLAHAEPLFERALRLAEKAYGPDHPQVAATLHWLGEMYRERGGEGDSERAEQLLTRAYKIRSKALGPEHPETVFDLESLASLLVDKGAFDEAERLYVKILALREKTFGAENAKLIPALNDLAVMYERKGDYAHGLPPLVRAVAISERELGPDHPDLATALTNLALVRFESGDVAQAVAGLARAADIRERNLALVLSAGSEEQKRVYLGTIADETDFSVWLDSGPARDDPRARRLALGNILRRKGRALDAMANQIGALRRHAAPEDRELLDRLTEARTRLANLKLGGASASTQAARRAEVAVLETETDRLEAEVSQRSAPFRAHTQPITIEAVQRAIPVGAALVELVSYNPYDPKVAKGKERGQRFGAARYAAYVLRSEGEPLFADLGEVALVDVRVARLRAELKNPLSKDVKAAARDLDEAVMSPIRKLLGDRRRLFISPDGALNLVPFAAFVDENGKYLVENYSITYLTSGRDLLRLQAEGESSRPPVVIANPLFTLRAPGAGDIDQGGTRSATHSIDLRGVVFTPLTGTAEEADAIRRVLKVAPLTGAGATEAALKRVAGPSILHIATHGFFLADEKQDGPESARGIKLVSGDTAQSPQLLAGENPLLRSGLALAGANDGRGENGEDGILTALEAAGLDLWGTKLVVLSACETGVGEVKNGDGVYGLRRALVLAGSETQVMSLWQVSDAATRDLMTDYYRRLQAGEGRTEALRQVQLLMLKGLLTTQGREGHSSSLKTERPKWNFSHPFFWASFIQSGDWRGLKWRAGDVK